MDRPDSGGVAQPDPPSGTAMDAPSSVSAACWRAASTTDSTQGGCKTQPGDRPEARREHSGSLPNCARGICSIPVARPGNGHDRGAVKASGEIRRVPHLTPIRRESLNQHRYIVAAMLENRDARRPTCGLTCSDQLCAALRGRARGVAAPLPQRRLEGRHVEPVSVSRRTLVRVDEPRGIAIRIPASIVFVRAQTTR